MKVKLSVIKKCLLKLGVDISTLSSDKIIDTVKQMLLPKKINFNIDRLPFLYRFKNEVVKLCLDYLQTAEGYICTKEKKLGVLDRKKDKANIEDTFVRWMFNSIAQHTFDFRYFLPTNDTFIDMNDIDFWIKNRILKKIMVPIDDYKTKYKLPKFPTENYKIILEKAKTDKDVPVLKTPIDVPTCTEAQLLRLRSLYFSLTDFTDFEQNVDKILNRYHFMGGLNNSLSTPPAVMDAVKKLNPPMISHELFGTPLNTCSPNYCSPFPDEKFVFNSSGSFFEFKGYKQDTVYFANPPFDEIICDKMADKLLADLEENEFSLIVIIPVWDTVQQQKYAKTHGTRDYGDIFHGYRKLVESRFFKSDSVLQKDKYPFYNYFTDKVHPSSTTHFINLGKKIDTEYLLHSFWADKRQQNYSSEIVVDMSMELINFRKSKKD
jgi:hypothetical protein